MNTLEIRAALVEVANKLGRPHYELSVVRDVVNAFKSDTHHPVKDLVRGVLPANVLPVTGSGRLKQLKDFCAPFGMQGVLARVSGIDQRYISKIINEKVPLTDEGWDFLSSAFARAETVYSRKGKVFKKDMHGTVNCYANGCRCIECLGVVQVKNMVKKYVGVAA